MVRFSGGGIIGRPIQAIAARGGAWRFWVMRGPGSVPFGPRPAPRALSLRQAASRGTKPIPGFPCRFSPRLRSRGTGPAWPNESDFRVSLAFRATVRIAGPGRWPRNQTDFRFSLRFLPTVRNPKSHPLLWPQTPRPHPGIAPPDPHPDRCRNLRSIPGTIERPDTISVGGPSGARVFPHVGSEATVSTTTAAQSGGTGRRSHRISARRREAIKHGRPLHESRSRPA